ncbi:terminase large subunit domain-containing protein [Haloarchaeobius sp. HRN-SO-5]|uniref:terminase large subunit domain-containing protein n=1 Tax=Haloarchaeobius sp. HRN-SO-5 TaxID=3446118 RepID=UPI003EB8EE5D
MSLASDGVTIDARDDGLDLEWAFWDKQLEAIDALRAGEYDVVVFRGGYGSGKSILGSRWIHETALEVPESDLLVLAQDSAKGGPTTYKVFFEQLPGEDTVPAKGGDPENSPVVDSYKQDYGGGTVTYITGAVARLGSADKWNRYAGGEFNAIWCDEVAHYETTDLYKLNRMLISRQRTTAGPNITLWTSTGNGFNQFYRFVERQIDPDGDPLPTRIRNVVADSRDNPFLAEMDKLRRQFEGTAAEKQGLAGGFAAPEGLVYPRFSREHHVVDETNAADLIPDGARPIYGYDAGWDHPRVLIEWYPTHYDQWLATDCYYAAEKPFEHLCDPADESGWVYDQGKPRATVYCEHEPEHILKFRQAGFRAVKAEKSLDEGIPFIRGLLERKGDPQRPGLLVSDRCVELVQEFQSYKEDHVGKSGDVPDHALDATRYALFSHTPTATDSDSSGVSYL